MPATRKVYLVDVYTGKRTNITEGYASHKQEGLFDVKVNFKKIFTGGRWVDAEKSVVYEDAYLEFA